MDTDLADLYTSLSPRLERIVRLTSDERQTLLFSATLDGEVGRLASRYTTDARRHEHVATAERRGCIDHRFWSATDDPNAILLFEQWQEQSALENRLAAPHTAAFLAQIGPAVDGTLDATRFEVSDRGPLFGR